MLMRSTSTNAQRGSCCRCRSTGRQPFAWRRAFRLQASQSETTPAVAAPTAPSTSRRGHQAPAAAAPPDPAVVRLREHQSAAARQTYPDECRTLIALSRYGVLSTLSVAEDSTGFPFGSIVGYADDEATGAPIFVFSTMSAHTKDIMQDGRASLTVTAPGFQGAADARVCLTGRLERVPDADKEAAKARYLAVHPDAFWISYGDFSFWKMSDIVSIRLVGGFARAGQVPAKLYASAKPDPVARLTDLVAAANTHGPAAWAAAVKAAVGADVGLEGCTVLSLDRLGLNLSAARPAASGGGFMKLRLPFAKPADSADAVRAQVDALLQAGSMVQH